MSLQSGLVALVKKCTHNGLSVDECPGGGAIIGQFVFPIREFVQRCMMSTYCQVFQKNVAIAAPSNGHLGQEFDALDTMYVRFAGQGVPGDQAVLPMKSSRPLDEGSWNGRVPSFA